MLATTLKAIPVEPTQEITPEMERLLLTNPAVKAEFQHYLNGPKEQGYGIRAAWEYVRVCAHPAVGGNTTGRRIPSKGASQLARDIALGVLKAKPDDWISTKNLAILTNIRPHALLRVLSSLKKYGYIESRNGPVCNEWRVGNPVAELTGIDLKLYNLIKEHPGKRAMFYAQYFEREYPRTTHRGISKNLRRRIAPLKRRGLIRSYEDPDQSGRHNIAFLVYEVVE